MTFSFMRLGDTTKRRRSLSFQWRAEVAGKQVDRKLVFEGHICQFELSYRHRFFFSIFARVVFAQILLRTVQLIFSTIRFRSYWCCVGKARSTKENQVFCYFFVICCSLVFDLRGSIFECGWTKTTFFLQKKKSFSLETLILF